MAKLEKTSKKVGSSAARQLKDAKASKDTKSVDASVLTPMPDRDKGAAKKKNKK